MPGDTSARLEWAPHALAAYLETLDRIGQEDPRTADLVRERVERALALILEYPRLGTPDLKRGYRRFAVPRTGHVIQYRITREGILVRLWYRARQNIR